MQPRNEEVIRIYKQKSRKVAQTPQIVQVASDSPKERLSIGRWIGNKLKETAKHYGKQILIGGAMLGGAVAAHYAGKHLSSGYKNFAERVFEPAVKNVIQAAKENPKAAIARALQFFRVSVKEKAVMLGMLAADAWLSDFQLYKKYLQPYVRKFALWAFDNYKLWKTFLDKWEKSSTSAKALGIIAILLHTVAYAFDEEYRNWYVGLGTAGAALQAAPALKRCVSAAVQKLCVWVKRGVNFMSYVKDIIVNYIKGKIEKVMKAARYLRRLFFGGEEPPDEEDEFAIKEDELEKFTGK